MGTNHLRFDAWNSCSTGHQVSETAPGTAWRRTREAKLAHQLRTGDCAVSAAGDQKSREGEWVWDSRARPIAVGAEDGDPKQRDIRSMMRVRKSASQGQEGGDTKTNTSTVLVTEKTMEEAEGQRKQKEESSNNANDKKEKGGMESTILRGTTVYINGQTTPVISDHKLKGLLVAHGATLALGLSRRVTHVIIGRPNRGPGRGGAGGGLAAGKIQKEVQRGGWRGIKVVDVEWVLECIKAEKRLPETRFAINLTNQRSVLAFM